MFFVCFTIIFSSCKKSLENKIEGLWTRVNVVNVNSSIFQVWNFDGGYLYVLQTKSGGGYDTLSHATYAVWTGVFTKHVSIEGSTDNSLIDEWTIDKLTNKKLVIFKKNGGLDYFEFTKE